jgi:CRISPR-associated protein Cas2
VYKIMRGVGERVQYSVFRCRLTNSAREKLRWRLAEAMHAEDSVLIVGLCGGCVQRIEALNSTQEWPEEPPKFEIL